LRRRDRLSSRLQRRSAWPGNGDTSRNERAVRAYKVGEMRHELPVSREKFATD
jgi:hypothetical protein